MVTSTVGPGSVWCSSRFSPQGERSFHGGAAAGRTKMEPSGVIAPLPPERSGALRKPGGDGLPDPAPSNFVEAEKTTEGDGRSRAGDSPGTIRALEGRGEDDERDARRSGTA